MGGVEAGEQAGRPWAPLEKLGETQLSERKELVFQRRTGEQKGNGVGTWGTEVRWSERRHFSNS